MHSKYNGYSFPLRDTVKREKVHFRNRYGIELCGRSVPAPRRQLESWLPWPCPGPLGL